MSGPKPAFYVLIAALSMVIGGLAAPATASPTTLAYTGEAFGTYAVLGTTVRSGKTARVSIGTSGSCTATVPAQPPISKAGTVGTLKTPFLTTGVINTTLEAFAEDPPGDTTGTRASAEAAGVSALGGLITADLIRAVSTTTHSSATGFQTSAEGTSLVNLRIGGLPVLGGTPPNTEIVLPGGLGTAVLNEQVAVVGSAGSSLLVNGLHVYIGRDDPGAGVKNGDQIIVASARSVVKSFDEATPTPRRVSGTTYGTTLTGRTTLTDPPSAFRSSPTALMSLPCLGTDGEVRSNTVVDVAVANGSQEILAAETVHTTATALVTSLSADATLTAKTEGVSLLGGLVTADLVRSVAHCHDDPSTLACDSDGSSFAELVVDGVAYGPSTPPNTIVDLGFAKIHLYRVITSPTSIEVRMIEVVVTGENTFGLDVDSVIRISVSRAAIAADAARTRDR